MRVSIYIVDDERMAIEYLMYLLERTDAEYEVVGSSTKSLTALTEIVRLKPDLVFMDIDMPVMDGLELSEKILKRVQTRIFLLTSYRDFDYVQKGIRIGAADYILKNDLSEELLKELLKKASGELAVEEKKRHRILEYNVRQFLLSQSEGLEDDHIYEHRPLQRYALIQVLPSQRICLKHQTEIRRADMDCFELQKLPCPDGLECSAFTQISDQEICGIFFIRGEATDGQALLRQFCEGLLLCFKEREADCRCIISDTCYHFLELQEAYREVHMLGEYIYACNDKRIWSAAEIREKKRERPELSQTWETLQDAMENGVLGDALQAAERIFRLSRQNLNIWEYMDNLQEMAHCLANFAQQKKLPKALAELPQEFADAKEAEAAVTDCLLRLMREEEKKEDKSYSPYVRQAMEYIQTNYARDISVPDIAEAVNLSEGHLRRLFRQELGMKVVDYLSDYRMECAKQLMKNGDNSITDVWERTGFASAQYFSYVFKKKEGILPRDYIRQIRNGERRRE